MSIIVDIISLFATLTALVLLALSAFFVIEIVGAFLWRKSERSKGVAVENCSLCVVIPAHNEELSLPATVQAVAAQCDEGDRILVVADNCTDETAARALVAGASVLERTDAERRGKGYALQFGLEHLRADPPDVVVFLDADCDLGEGALDILKRAAMETNGPVQALYLMRAGDGSPKQAVAAFAWLLMNAVRMRGLDRLFGVTRVTGAGFALPWALAAKAELASGEIVEDLALTIALTEQGAPPRLAPDALVTSVFPTSEQGVARQRARWEHGALRLAGRTALPLIVRGITQRDWRALALGVDIAIPPITVFVVALIAFMATALVGAALSAWVFDAASAARSFSGAASLAFNAIILTSLGVVVAWFGFGRDVLAPNQIGALVSFVKSKARVYGRDARASTKEWTRTEREPAGATGREGDEA